MPGQVVLFDESEIEDYDFDEEDEEEDEEEEEEENAGELEDGDLPVSREEFAELAGIIATHAGMITRMHSRVEKLEDAVVKLGMFTRTPSV